MQGDSEIEALMKALTKRGYIWSMDELRYFLSIACPAAYERGRREGRLEENREGGVMRIELGFERAPYKWDHRQRWQLVVKLFDGERLLSESSIDLHEIEEKLVENEDFVAP